MVEEEFKTHFPSETVREGKAKALVPKLKAFVTQPSDYAPSKAPVFYNPVMELNRDISVLALQTHQRIVNREIFICEPLTGSGIRGVRFAAEIHSVKKVVISDISERAVKLAKFNVRLNGLQNCVTVKHKDANCLLSCHGAPRKRFDVVDVDPFGSPVLYLDSAIRALRNNGLLAVTATDLAPLCGVHSKACLRKYGGKPLRTEYCHELAVRLLAGCIATVAAKHDIGIRVVFSHSTNHYIRVYAEIGYGAKKADASVGNLGYVLHCFNCLHRETAKSLFAKRLEKCPACGSRMDYAGPLLLERIFDKQFCKLMEKENIHTTFRNSGKIAKLLSLAEGEAEAPVTYYVLDKISDELALPVPSVDAMLQILRGRGFQAFPTHFNSRGIRTDAPALIVQNSLQELVVAA
ncbi:MAG: tRNA (guanine(10)-N(2))-dimethyltransferase [Candidatus Bathyarchaeota archaeon]|nr:MAG: tRNA (guanine(10)-N(2))-dimethyltransferase [Candidatus Bathyarchaeota archaeon]